MKKAYLKYLLAVLLFGTNGIISSQISLDSYEIVFLRTLLGSIFLICVFLLGKNKFRISQYRKEFVFIVLSGMAMGVGWMFLYEAYAHIGVGLASLLYYCGPVIVMIMSPVIFKEKLTLPKITGFMAVVTGIILVNGRVAALGGNTWGLFCGAMSAIMYFLMLISNKQAKNIIGMENSLIQLTASFLAVAVFVGFKQHFVIHVPQEDWLWIIFLGLVNTGIGCYLYFSSLYLLPVQTVAVCGYIEPLSAVVFAALLLGEHMTFIQVIGAVFIIGGAMCGELVKPKLKTCNKN